MEEGQRAVHVAIRGCEQAAAARTCRERGAPSKPACSLLVSLKDDASALEVAERDKRLDVLDDEANGARLTNAGSLDALDERAETLMYLGRFVESELEQAERPEARRLREHRSALGEIESHLGGGPCCVLLAETGRGERARRAGERAPNLLAGRQRHLVALVGHTQCLLESARETLGDAQVREDERQGTLVTVQDRTLTDDFHVGASRVEIVAPYARDVELKARPLHHLQNVERRFFDRNGRTKRPACFRSTKNGLDHPLRA
jgi:hypothetical protein